MPDRLGPLPVHAKAEDYSARDLVVIDNQTGEEIARVVEAHTDEGWLIRHATDEAGRLVKASDGSGPKILREERSIRFERRPRT